MVRHGLTATQIRVIKEKVKKIACEQVLLELFVKEYKSTVLMNIPPKRLQFSRTLQVSEYRDFSTENDLRRKVGSPHT